MSNPSFVSNTGSLGTTCLAAFSGLLLLGAATPACQAQNIVDPTNTFAGQTYSQWAAGWWQHYMSLPSTNNPFISIAATLLR